MFSLDAPSLELNRFGIDFLGFWGISCVFQEVEDKTSFGRMRIANSILEAALYEV